MEGVDKDGYMATKLLARMHPISMWSYLKCAISVSACVVVVGVINIIFKVLLSVFN